MILISDFSIKFPLEKERMFLYDREKRILSDKVCRMSDAKQTNCFDNPVEEGIYMIIFHIDANSAYLSWEAAYRIQNGASVDLREIPSVVGGNEKQRHGIVLAKSIPSKKYGIQTGESLYSARQKCPDLVVVPPNYDLYIKCSDAMYQILCEYSPIVQRFSVDECFLDYTDSEKRFGDPVQAAFTIKERIKKELGFTVNIGVSTNKILAKMASEFKKPDKLHTLFPDEMKDKLWPLPVEDLFMVGRATTQKLKKININTIGELAHANPHYLKTMLKSHGLLVWQYANGLDDSKVKISGEILQKGLGNSTTTAFDVTTKKEALMVLLSLTECTAMRLRSLGYLCSLISVSLRSSHFEWYSHQKKLRTYTNSTSEIFSYITDLFEEVWKGEPLRNLGVRFSDFSTDEYAQLSFFDSKEKLKNQKLDGAIDKIRLKYGDGAIVRSVFLHSGINPIQGGVNDGEYPMMTSIL